MIEGSASYLTPTNRHSEAVTSAAPVTAQLVTSISPLQVNSQRSGHKRSASHSAAVTTISPIQVSHSEASQAKRQSQRSGHHYITHTSQSQRSGHKRSASHLYIAHAILPVSSI